jgi:hypothetical protein
MPILQHRVAVPYDASKLSHIMFYYHIPQLHLEDMLERYSHPMLMLNLVKQVVTVVFQIKVYFNSTL